MMKAQIYSKIRDCSKVGMQGWYNSNVGVIRKPNGSVDSYKGREIDNVIQMNPKKWYASKTLWAGVLEILGGIAFALSGELNTGGYLTVAGVATIILRVITKTPVTR